MVIRLQAGSNLPLAMQQRGVFIRCCVLSGYCCVLFACAVDNVILRDPPVLGVPLLAGLNLVPGAPQQPCPGETKVDFVVPQGVAELVGMLTSTQAIYAAGTKTSDVRVACVWLDLAITVLPCAFILRA
jgi:hypothetical protein